MVRMWQRCTDGRAVEARRTVSRVAEPFHEPTPPAPLPGGERAFTRVFRFPSWEGLGVGSWSQCMRKSEWRLSMNRWYESTFNQREEIASKSKCKTDLKAALKTQAFQTLTRSADSAGSAKRLQCVRFIGAYRPPRASWG